MSSSLNKEFIIIIIIIISFFVYGALSLVKSNKTSDLTMEVDLYLDPSFWKFFLTFQVHFFHFSHLSFVRTGVGKLFC